MKPRRLAKRYFKNNPLFALKILGQLSGLKKNPIAKSITNPILRTDPNRSRNKSETIGGKMENRLFVVIIFLALWRNAQGQGFANLDFESSVIVTSSPTPYGFNVGTANVPGWTEYYGWGDANYSGGTTLGYNGQTLDAAGVSLQDTNYWTPAIQGKYSIFLQGGTIFAAQAYPWMTNGASIGQTGQIPSDANSISYWASNGGLLVSFAGQAISFTEVSNTLNHSFWVADISAYAGQTGELLFKAPYPNGQTILDNIQFSSFVIPEPSEFALATLGALFVGFRRWRNSSI